MQCQECHTKVIQGQKFCATCGKAQPLRSNPSTPDRSVSGVLATALPTQPATEPAAPERGCAQCGASVAPDFAFCQQCGSKMSGEADDLKSPCGRCGEPMPADIMFCQYCGNRRDAGHRGPTSPTPAPSAAVEAGAVQVDSRLTSGWPRALRIAGVAMLPAVALGGLVLLVTASGVDELGVGAAAGMVALVWRGTLAATEIDGVQAAGSVSALVSSATLLSLALLAWSWRGRSEERLRTWSDLAIAVCKPAAVIALTVGLLSAISQLTNPVTTSLKAFVLSALTLLVTSVVTDRHGIAQLDPLTDALGPPTAGVAVSLVVVFSATAAGAVIASIAMLDEDAASGVLLSVLALPVLATGALTAGTLGGGWMIEGYLSAPASIGRSVPLPGWLVLVCIALVGVAMTAGAAVMILRRGSTTQAKRDAWVWVAVWFGIALGLWLLTTIDGAVSALFLFAEVRMHANPLMLFLVPLFAGLWWFIANVVLSQVSEASLTKWAQRVRRPTVEHQSAPSRRTALP